MNTKHHAQRAWKYTVVALAAILLLSLLIPTASAEDTVYGGTEGNVTWTLNADTGELTLSGSGVLLTAPWDQHRASIRKVIVGDDIIAIGISSFADCTNLTEVVLGPNVSTLWNDAFRNCTALTEITFPPALTYVYASAFMGCTGLERVNVADIRDWLEMSFVDEASNPCSMGAVLYVNGKPVQDVTVPDGITSIHHYAFDGMAQIRSVILPEGVISLGSHAFHNCGEMTRVSLPSTLASVGDSAFAGTTPDFVLYEGTADQWQSNVTVKTGNEALTSDIFYHNGHTFDREVIHARYLAHKADCQRAATYYLSCICGEGGTEATFSVGDALGHHGGQATCLSPAVCTACGEPYGGLGEHTEGAPATCTEAQTCTVCYTILADKLGHIYTEEVTPPTCTERGFTTHTCSRCMASSVDTYTDVIAHTPGPAATCTEAQTCTVCHTVLADKLGHSYTEEVTAPTCTERGFTTHTCSRCEASYVDTYTDVTAHTPGPAATCTESQTCTVCHTVLANKLGHSYTEEVTAPTCTERGFTTHTCGRCEASYVDTYTDVTAHTPGPAATCTESQVCTSCHVVLNHAKGHAFTELVVEPSCTGRGYTMHICKNCELLYLDSYTDILPHTPGDEATCTEAQVCVECFEVLTEALGHRYTDEITAPTCTERGFTTHTCDRCQQVVEDSYTDPTGHTEGAAPTCTVAQTCTVCHAVLATQTGHDYQETASEATCTTPGFVMHSCSRCESVYFDNLTEELGHTAGDWVIHTEPKPGVGGLRHKLCTICEKVLEVEELEPLPEETQPTPDGDGSAEGPDDPADPDGDGDPADETANREEQEKFNEMMGNVTGCKKVQTILVYVLIGLLMIVAAVVFWSVDNKRKNDS